MTGKKGWILYKGVLKVMIKGLKQNWMLKDVGTVILICDSELSNQSKNIRDMLGHIVILSIAISPPHSKVLSISSINSSSIHSTRTNTLYSKY